MLLDLPTLLRAYGLRPTGVLHVGAHTGEEAELYDDLGLSRVVWVEGNPELAEGLRALEQRPGHAVVAALVDERADEDVEFHLASGSQASSLLDLGTSRIHHPEIEVERTIRLSTTTIDDLARERDLASVNMLNLDIQGAELRALRGAVQTLSQVDYIYTEVNREELYVGGALVGELDAFLVDQGFTRVATYWGSAGWGDAFYVRGGVPAYRRALAHVLRGAHELRARAERTRAARALARLLGRGS